MTMRPVQSASRRKTFPQSPSCPSFWEQSRGSPDHTETKGSSRSHRRGAGCSLKPLGGGCDELGAGSHRHSTQAPRGRAEGATPCSSQPTSHGLDWAVNPAGARPERATGLQRTHPRTVLTLYLDPRSFTRIHGALTRLQNWAGIGGDN